MTEEDKKKEPVEEPATPDSPQEPDINAEAAATDMIAKANEAVERLESANKELGKLLAKQEQLRVEASFGGTAEAGKREETKEQKEIKEARKLVEGTGFEDEIFPDEKKEK